jgi:hypothetical protein
VESGVRKDYEVQKSEAGREAVLGGQAPTSDAFQKDEEELE